MQGVETSLNPREIADASVLASLEPDQLTEAKRQRLPRRQLKRSEVFLLWSLRVYLFIMVGVVVYQLLAVTRP